MNVKLRALSIALAVTTTAVTLAACGGGGSPGPAPVPTVQATPTPFVPQSDDWNTFGHDMRRTGYDSLPNPISKSNVSQVKLKWTYSTGTSGNEFYASPIVVNGVVYVVGTDSKITALSAATGKVLWQHLVDPQYPTYQTMLTPSIYDGILFVGTHTSTGNLFALDPATGSQLWHATVPGFLRAAPVSVNGELIIGGTFGDSPACAADGINAFDEKTGVPGPAWLLGTSASDGGGVWGALTYTGSSIVFGTSNSCNKSLTTGNAVISVTTGLTQQWSFQTASAFSDDDVASGVLDLSGIGYVSAKNGNLYAFNLATGAVLWNKALGAPDFLGGFATPGYVDGTIFASRGYDKNPDLSPIPGGALYGLTSDGQTLWSVTTQQPVLGQVVGANGIAYAQLDNSVDALDPVTGKTLWSYATQGDFEASPVIVPSGLYAADLSGTVYAFSLPSSGSNSVRAASLPPAWKGMPTRYVPVLPAHCRVMGPVIFKDASADGR